MQRIVALRERGRLAALLQRLRQSVRRQRGWREPDRRNLRTLRQIVLGILTKRSTRLVTLGQTRLGQRRAGSSKAIAGGLAYFLRQARCPSGAVSRRLAEAAVRELDPQQLVTYQGQAVLVVAPTD